MPIKIVQNLNDRAYKFRAANFNERIYADLQRDS